MPSFFDARILIVDDTPDNILLLSMILRSAGYSNVMGETNPLRAMNTIREFKPDLLVLDLMMPLVSGFDVLCCLPAQLPPDEYLPVLVVTSDVSPQAREQALAKGASDFLQRPHQEFDVLLRVRNQLRTRKLHLQLKQQNHELEAQVLARTLHLQTIQDELKAAQIDVIERLARTAEHRDDDTGAHTRRVACTCRRIAQRLGLDENTTEILFRAAPLHDVGKIAVPDTILLKPTKLTPSEFDVMKKHTHTGASILSNGHSRFLETASSIALNHHEHWDGSGYPNGLSGDKIPLEGRILAVADVFDALTHHRPYKKAWTIEQACDEIKREAGRQFDPHIVEAFLSLDWQAPLPLCPQGLN